METEPALVMPARSLPADFALIVDDELRERRRRLEERRERGRPTEHVHP